MHLSLLSEGYVSDSFNDAGPIIVASRPTSGSIHFVALCRGIIFLVALAVPVGMTLFAGTTATDVGLDSAQSTASRAGPTHAKNG